MQEYLKIAAMAQFLIKVLNGPSDSFCTHSNLISMSSILIAIYFFGKLSSWWKNFPKNAAKHERRQIDSVFQLSKIISGIDRKCQRAKDAFKLLLQRSLV